MATVLLGWWRSLLRLMQAARDRHGQRWIEPSNAVTRAIFSGAVPELPTLTPARVVVPLSFAFDWPEAAVELPAAESAVLAPAEEEVAPPAREPAGSGPRRAGRAA